MKNVQRSQLTVLFLLWGIGGFAQNVAKIDTGAINGANYKIIFPENWKGKLEQVDDVLLMGIKIG